MSMPALLVVVLYLRGNFILTTGSSVSSLTFLSLSQSLNYKMV